MRVERIVLGTSNPAKKKEWVRLIHEFLPELHILTISELGDFPDASEEGQTFEENAGEKASHFARLANEYVLADDGGFEIDALGGIPGVKSRRILPGDKEGTDRELIDFVLEKMADLPKEARTAKLTSAVALSDPVGQIIFRDKASFVGFVPENQGPVLIEGYPFRSLLFVEEAGKTYAELTHEEFENLSHKRLIAKRLSRFLQDTDS